MSSITDVIRPELSELSAHEFAKIAESDFVYTLASTNVDQLVPNMVTVYITMRSRMISIEPEHPELFALEFGKIAEYYFVYTLASTNIN